MKNALLFIWQLPQHLAGLLILNYLRVTKKIKQCDTGPGPGKVMIYMHGEGRNDKGRGFSLGIFIFGYERHIKSKTFQPHEGIGHSTQSLWWGPLYLLVIGIYSGLLGPYQKLFMKHLTQKERDAWYFRRWTEKQADKIAGIVRS